MKLNMRDYDLMSALNVLRYLSSAQIRGRWFKGLERSVPKRRLCALVQEGLLLKVRLEATQGREALTAYRLATGGLAALRRRGAMVDGLYQDVQPEFLRHLLDTNAVYLALTDEELGPAAPFTWLGSHRAQMEYFAHTGPAGGFTEVRRILTPDAITTPKLDPAASRCLIELDRGTETITPGYGRNSIVAKLHAYRTFIRRKRHGGERTGYQDAFPMDTRPARVVFVLATLDPRGQRKASILAAAKREAPELEVRAVRLDDAAAIRAATLPAVGVILPFPTEATLPPVAAPAGLLAMTEEDAAELRAAYVGGMDALRAAMTKVTPQQAGDIKRLADACRAVLKRARGSQQTSTSTTKKEDHHAL